MIDTNLKKIKEILNRGVEQIIERKSLLKKLKSGKKLRIKLGIDPTGPKIHIGRAIQFWKLRAFQELGHQIVLIIGDFTAQIGDASDKQTMRKPLTEKEVKRNMKNYTKQIGKILDMKRVELHYNSKWLKELKIRDLLNLAMSFTAQQMIQRRNFKERWEQEKPIGIHELVYPLLQGYDSVVVRADLEIGGSDQLFNLKVGREIQKIFGQPSQDIMTLKMLYGLDGRKMSTSWGNVINIVDSPKEMYGKIMSMRDELIGDYFELATNLPLKEIEKIKKSLKNKKLNPRDAKDFLGREIVGLYYNKKQAKLAQKEFNLIFRDKRLPSKIPIFKTSKKIYPILDLLFDSNLTPSKTEAKRLILQKAVEIDNILKENWQESVELKNGAVIRVGKRRFVKIKLTKSSSAKKK